MFPEWFPEGVRWDLVALTTEELAQVRYIAWDWWLERSGGSRLAVDYAARIRERESSLATQRAGSGITGRSPAGYGTVRPSHVS